MIYTGVMDLDQERFILHRHPSPVVRRCPSLLRRSLQALFLTLFVCVGLGAVEATCMEPLDALLSSLPRRVGEWKAVEGEDRFYDRETIFDYIDGAGEVYRAYNMRKCLARRYEDSRSAPIVLDVFDMGSPDDAYGVFTHDLEGEPIDAGQQGLYRAGWLRYWKGRFFVSVFDETQSPSSRETASRLAQAVAQKIGETGPKPDLVSRLPSPGLDARTVRYLHDPVILNTHYYLSDENILCLEPQSQAVLAEYRRDGGKGMLLIVSYPSEGEAAEAGRSVHRHYLPDAADGATRLENGRWAAVGCRGRFLAFVPEADTAELSKDLVREALHSLVH